MIEPYRIGTKVKIKNPKYGDVIGKIRDRKLGYDNLEDIEYKVRHGEKNNGVLYISWLKPSEFEVIRDKSIKFN